jgi:hypothetical protein
MQILDWHPSDTPYPIFEQQFHAQQLPFGFGSETGFVFPQLQALACSGAAPAIDKEPPESTFA